MNSRRRRTTAPSSLTQRLLPLWRAGSGLAAGLALAAGLVFVATAVARVDAGRLWEIRYIELQGDGSAIGLAPAQVEALLADRPRGFFVLDLPWLREELATHPWVRSVELVRRWPDTLEVWVKAPVPVARWGDDWLVDRYGMLFGPVDQSDWQYLPRLQGEPGRQVTLMHRYLDASARLADAGLEVTGVRESARQAWSIDLDGGGQVLMGRDPDLARLDQLVALAPVLRERFPAPLARVDLRYPRGVAVAWQEPDNKAMTGAVR
jgi:cell division protein FtsQ